MKVSDLKNGALVKWINEVAALTTPDSIEIADGSEAFYQKMIQITIDGKLATVLDQKKRPGCYLYRSDPSDVARVESRTFIASKHRSRRRTPVQPTTGQIQQSSKQK
jgi:phosphoenolpyruvate carboxykinase (GTP)